MGLTINTKKSENKKEARVKLSAVEKNNEVFYRISNVHLMRPFFMSIVSDSNHWMFVSSNGGISAGRKNAELALFPYYTEDKIIDTAEITGSKTIIRVYKNENLIIWEPFSIRSEMGFVISRNLYQSRFGNKIIFEEFNHDLELSFQYEWNSSNLYGFVKQSRLLNQSGETVQLEIADGLQNILPYGVPSDLQTKTSNLADAYKRSELVGETGLGIFALSAIIVDKAEPSEALKANVAWGLGLSQPLYLLSSLQLQRFRDGKKIIQEEDIKGEKGAYFVVSHFSIEAGEEKQWLIAANVNQNHAAVVQLNESIKNDKILYQKVLDDIQLGSVNLQQLNAAADGFQYTSDDLKNTRHFSNVMFNIMRGGIFDNNYQIEKWDFRTYLCKANKKVFEEVQIHLNQLGESFSVFELKSKAQNSGNSDFVRLATEYLPLKFSRRHGDPSRPWNQFSINTRSEIDGSKILDYQGNWRDIFQNWEALICSYPAFVEGMIYKFLNASTFDGYNPYRVTKDGFDWETIEPDNPWSYIGYWGDHQVIYLLKFLEILESHYPGRSEELLSKEEFVYANVPYIIKSYNEIVKDPKATIDFDHNNERRISERVKTMGADGALLTDSKSKIYHISFIEKIFATVLSKLSNFVPEGGIWMNTQRPEWNDANNALVGNGLSMVTVCYLRRFLNFLYPIIEKTSHRKFTISAELLDLFIDILKTLKQNKNLLSGAISEYDRKKIVDALGLAGSNYRNKIYTNSFSGIKKLIVGAEVLDFLNISLQFLEHTICANKRSDSLYHSYNLMSYDEKGIKISYLSEMLEGQVAVLSSGYLSAGESLQLLDSLRKSSLYRKDQNSYFLYPNKELPRFLEKNVIPAESVEKSELLKKLLFDGNAAILERDTLGKFHFNGNFKNSNDLKKALKKLDISYHTLVKKELETVLKIFEEVFNHKEFTGRSGTFYGYEGLGSIYWHMVSKLALAVQETCLRAIKENTNATLVKNLIFNYYEIVEGIGVHKSPELYGAFPVTPYSHTPLNKGAQQPGMTGQVKEDILCRMGELGIQVQDGQLVFNPQILHRNEFLSKEQQVELIDIQAGKIKINLEKNCLLFTYCQVPVLYIIKQKEGIEIERRDGSVESIEGLTLNESDTSLVWERSGAIKLIRVFLKETRLRT